MHGGHDDHGATSHGTAFAIGVALNLGFVVVEVVFGLAVDSLALIADAGHNLGDVVGLLLAWGAAWLAGRAPRGRFTYGFRRATILAALGSGLLLLVALGGICWEAVRRLGAPGEVGGTTMLVVAGVGVGVNTATALLFMRGRHDDLNIRGAFLHMVADAAVSLGVVVGGAVILATGWTTIDPLLSLAIVAVVLWSTLGLLRDAGALSLDAAPRSVDLGAVRRWLGARDGVTEVHDLHVWAISTTQTALTAHLVMPGGSDDAFLHAVVTGLRAQFGVDHATLQVERGDPPDPCAREPGCAP